MGVTTLFYGKKGRMVGRERKGKKVPRSDNYVSRSGPASDPAGRRFVKRRLAGSTANGKLRGGHEKKEKGVLTRYSNWRRISK